MSELNKSEPRKTPKRWQKEKYLVLSYFFLSQDMKEGKETFQKVYAVALMKSNARVSLRGPYPSLCAASHVRDPLEMSELTQEASCKQNVLSSQHHILGMPTVNIKNCIQKHLETERLWVRTPSQIHSKDFSH